ncbi:hypothetical protein [Aliivibrio sp. EL58]|uniref:hypothetical protein n=1 Tax=Aliivibrio sp. EL58 TaxID=2107582 RepID=UPI0013C438FB|nr:hypothetical protein [Aliivibrio sp. EL58]
MMNKNEIFAFMNSYPQPSVLTTTSGIMVYANSSYKSQFYCGVSNEEYSVIDNIIGMTNDPLIKANALYCKHLESVFLVNRQTCIKRELFFYKKYITLRTIIFLNEVEYILLLIVEEIKE